MYLKEYYKKMRLINHKVSVISDYDQDIINDGIYVAIKDLTYIDNAIKKGAKTIIYNKKYKIKKIENINYIGVESPKKELSKLLKYEYSFNHNKKPIFIGITGTNGKTTTSYLLYQYLKWLSNDVLYIGTGWIYSISSLKETVENINNTTPSISYLYKYLRNNKYDYVILEVSSQGIEEGRILGIEFDIISITNLSTDHLDYHETINQYKIVKGKIIYSLNNESKYKKIILNKEDNHYNYFANLSLNDVVSYGINDGDYKPIHFKSNLNGIELVIRDKKIIKIQSNLIGDFNMYNIMNLYTINKVLNYNINYFKSFINNKRLSIPGRMNIINKDNCTFVVDYAHTIDSVKNILSYIKKIINKENIIVVLGAGGNRDKSKRRIIGKYVTKNADYVYFTEDNSRNEKTEEILYDLISDVNTNNFEIIVSRKKAIMEAYKKFNSNSYILVLGKGNENYIIHNNYLEEHNDIKYIKGLM